jgi:Flp pilus assembly pilin Flp
MKRLGNERGLTLVEFTIVAALGTVVMLTISSFYLASQSMWLDSSIQAVAQRDASMFVTEIGRRIEAADTAVLPDATHLILYRNSVQTASITWDPEEPDNDVADITDFENGNETTNQWPANGRLKALQFRVEGPNPRIVYLDSLRVEMPSGESLYLSSAFGLYNHP